MLKIFFSSLLLVAVPFSALAFTYDCGGAQPDGTHEFIELYDFKNQKTVQVLIGNEGFAYHPLLSIRLCDGIVRYSTTQKRASFELPYIELISEICGSTIPVIINSNVPTIMQSRIEGIVIEKETVDKLAPNLWQWDSEGELIIWSKWADHRDQSQIISYRLYGDELLAVFGIVDNCIDQSQTFNLIYDRTALP